MIKQRSTKKTQSIFFIAAGLGISLLAASGEINAQDLVDDQGVPITAEKKLSACPKIS